MKRPATILAYIAVAQFCGASMWFAGNAILPQLQTLYHWPADAVGHLTTAVQVGFIMGTLAFAISGVTDRHQPSLVFLISSIAGALCNALILLDVSSLPAALVSRALTGICLAGIYPVGMKIAADWSEKGLGNWLGTLVGTLVVGTALPHGLKLFPALTEPQPFILGISALAFTGGLLVYAFVPVGPYRKPSSSFSWKSIRSVFHLKNFRAAAFGYYGHMWELYALWAFVPAALQLHQPTLASGWAFAIIGTGSAGCIAGGMLSRKYGSYRVAHTSLVVSGLCCLVSPMLFAVHAPVIFIFFMMLWGAAVAADSPQFSAMVAQQAPPEVRGSAISMVTSMGFAITIFSIQLLTFTATWLGEYMFLVLLPGPLFGLLTMKAYSLKKPVA